jgi:hypothetical protein
MQRNQHTGGAVQVNIAQPDRLATSSSTASRIAFLAISQHVGMHFSDAQPAMVATIASSIIRLNMRFIITSPSLVVVIGSLRQRAAAPTRQRKTSFATVSSMEQRVSPFLAD